MMPKGTSGNLGDPQRFPQEIGRRSVNLDKNGRDSTDGAVEVGSVHSRGNALGNQSTSQHEETLEGTDKDTQRDRETLSSRRGGATAETKLERIATIARENHRYKFTSLASLLNENFLAVCFTELKRGKAPGVDGVSVEAYYNLYTLAPAG